MDASMFTDMAKKTTKKWTKQRKAEERRSNAYWNRQYAMTQTRRITVKEVAYDYMETAYLKASANGTLPAVARQIMYAARGYILERTGKESLDGAGFQTLLKDYMFDYPTQTAGWNVVFDARGNYHEPHTDKKIPLGTLSVRDYVRKVRNGATLKYSAPDVVDELFPTIGHINRISAVMFIEKEGFMPLLKKAELAEKYDIAIMSTKGMSVIAARVLVDELCSDIPLLIVRDFDKAGFSIASTIQSDSKHHTFNNSINVIDLGLRLEDTDEWELESEPVSYGNTAARKVRANLEKNGATGEEINFLCEDPGDDWRARGSGKRIELNAFASDQFIEWLESKLEENGIEKVIPDVETLEDAYRHAYKLTRFQKIIDKREKKIARKAEELEIPDDLEYQIRDAIEEDPTLPWDKAINQILMEEDGE